MHLDDDRLLLIQQRRQRAGAVRARDPPIRQAFGLSQQALQRALELKQGERPPRRGGPLLPGRPDRQHLFQRRARVGQRVLGHPARSTLAVQRQIRQRPERLALRARRAEDVPAHQPAVIADVPERRRRRLRAQPRQRPRQPGNERHQHQRDRELRQGQRHAEVHAHVGQQHALSPFDVVRRSGDEAVRQRAPDPDGRQRQHRARRAEEQVQLDQPARARARGGGEQRAHGGAEARPGQDRQRRAQVEVAGRLRDPQHQDDHRRRPLERRHQRRAQQRAGDEPANGVRPEVRR